MKQQNCLIIGASHAAAALAPELRKQGWQGQIQVIGDEPYLPYHRPPLSKDFLSNAKDINGLTIRPESVYEKNDIEFKLGHRVTSIDRSAKSVSLSSGEQLTYTKLALCTGSRAREIALPGIELAGIHYLRTIDDVLAIKQQVENGRKAVIVGGGYIGLETAAVLTKLGMQVTILEMLPRILARVTAPELSTFYTRVHTEQGVTIHCDVTVEGFEGNASNTVQKVICQGGNSFDADLVIIGAGIVPNIELADEAGLHIDNGIVVNEYAQTSDPDIVAAGDCTSHPNKLLDRNLRLESVPNASEQAKSAASSICGEQREYNQIPWFWSDQYHYKLQIAGLNSGYDQVVIRGNIESGDSFAIFYLQQGKLLAADCVNRPKEFMLTKRLLTQGQSVDADKLADESIDPKEFLT